MGSHETIRQDHDPQHLVGVGADRQASTVDPDEALGVGGDQSRDSPGPIASPQRAIVPVITPSTPIGKRLRRRDHQPHASDVGASGPLGKRAREESQGQDTTSLGKRPRRAPKQFAALK